jgi:hypothetical protein
LFSKCRTKQKFEIPNMECRFAWLHALARVHDGATVLDSAALPLRNLALFDARPRMPRSLASVPGAAVARFLPHGRVVVVAITHDSEALPHMADALFEGVDTLQDVVMRRVAYSVCHKAYKEIADDLHDALAIVVVAPLVVSLSHVSFMGVSWFSARPKGCALVFIGWNTVVGRKGFFEEKLMVAGKHTPLVFGFDRSVTLEQVTRSWLWHAVSVLIPLGIADTRKELLARYKDAHASGAADAVSLALDAYDESSDAPVRQFLDVLSRAMRLRPLDDDKVNKMRTSVSRLYVAGVPWAAVPWLAYARELEAACVHAGAGADAVCACLDGIAADPVLRHVHAAVEGRWPPSMDVRDLRMRGPDAALDDSNVPRFVAALKIGVHDWSRRTVLHWLRYILLMTQPADIFFDVTRDVMLELSDCGDAETIGSARLDVDNCDAEVVIVWMGTWVAHVVTASSAAHAADAASVFSCGGHFAVVVPPQVAAPSAAEVHAQFFCKPACDLPQPPSPFPQAFWGIP